MATPAVSDPRPDNSLLIVDDDKPFLSRLAKAMEARGYSVRTAETLEAGRQAITAGGRCPPAPMQGSEPQRCASSLAGRASTLAPAMSNAARRARGAVPLLRLGARLGTWM